MSERMWVCLADECSILTCETHAVGGRCSCGAELVECLRPTSEELSDVINLSLREDRGLATAVAAVQAASFEREGLNLPATLCVTLDILARHIMLAYALQQRIRAKAVREMH